MKYTLYHQTPIARSKINIKTEVFNQNNKMLLRYLAV